MTFAYGTMLFTKANAESCQIIKNMLDKYCCMSAQLANFHKSTFQCIKNVPLEQCLVSKEILCIYNGFP